MAKKKQTLGPCFCCGLPATIGDIPYGSFRTSSGGLRTRRIALCSDCAYLVEFRGWTIRQIQRKAAKHGLGAIAP